MSASRSARVRGACLSMSFVLCGSAVQADAVSDWNEIMEMTVLEQPDPFLRLRTAAITQVAVFEAVNAIVGDYEPYLGNIRASRDASPEAAAISAAHRVLTALNPGSAAKLDALQANSLGKIGEGNAKRAGIETGKRAADALLAVRASDGSDVVEPYTPGTKPGRWQ